MNGRHNGPAFQGREVNLEMGKSPAEMSIHSTLSFFPSNMQITPTCINDDDERAKDKVSGRPSI
jgi:hypothetical protein